MKKSWVEVSQLEDHAQSLETFSLAEAFTDNQMRSKEMSVEFQDIYFDYSKHLATNETLILLEKLFNKSEVRDKVQAVFSGLPVNGTEQRKVLHTALRASTTNDLSLKPKTEEEQESVDTLHKMRDFVAKLTDEANALPEGKKLTFIHVGIGGSYLGPKVVLDGLAAYHNRKIQVKFLSNIDSALMEKIVAQCDPLYTVVCIASKSFSTQETLLNGQILKQWLSDNGLSGKELADRFVAITSGPEKAINYGVASDNIFPMWDWVGGRYSVWSAIGLPVAIQVGFENFQRFLLGAKQADEHFTTQPFDKNIPVLMAMFGIWYINFFKASSHCIVPYNHGLRAFPAFLQQLEMESNGKRVEVDGSAVEFQTSPVVWGGEGTNGQHAFHQMLFQGTQVVPIDLILAAQPEATHTQLQDALLANGLAQSQALAFGKNTVDITQELQQQGMTEEEIAVLLPHKQIPANKPHSLFVMRQVTPESLGSLIAFYEHKVLVQGAVWNINSFDQWGVELGKKITAQILPQLLDDAKQNPHVANAEVIERLKVWRQN